MKKYKGSCHCRRVVFEFDGDVGKAMECNCSICRKKGAIWHGTDDAHFRVLAGESDLCLYQFGTLTAKHYFCRICGVSPFGHPRIDPARWVVNLRCVDDIDVSALNVYTFDGDNWEVAAKELLQARSNAGKA